MTAALFWRAACIGAGASFGVLVAGLVGLLVVALLDYLING